MGSIKRILHTTVTLLGKRILSREVVDTLVQVAGSIVSHTPLSSISADPNEPFPVCPAALLTLKENENSHKLTEFNEADLNAYGRRR